MFETMPSLTLLFSIKNSTCRRVGFVKTITPRLFTLLALLLLSPQLRADGGECSRAMSVVFKPKVPCDGLLVPANEAHELLKCEIEKLPKCLIDRELDRKKCDARNKNWKETFEAERDRAYRLQQLLDQATKVSPPEAPWWKHPVLWTAIGMAVGAASTYAILKLTEE